MKMLRIAMVGMALFLLGNGNLSRGQVGQPPVPPMGQAPGLPSAGHRPGLDDDPHAPNMEERQATARNNDRQKRLMDDTNKLLALATDLKEQVDKTNKDILSVDVIKKADEIEKLAHSVKERMKG